jgi:sulfide:quinone oxidoreductase
MYRVLVAAVPVSIAAFSFTRSHRVNAEENTPSPATQNYNVVIIGAGTAGLAVANQLKRSKDVTMAIVDPSTTHYYQPGWTLLAAGLIKWEKIVSVTQKYIPKGIFQNASLLCL